MLAFLACGVLGSRDAAGCVVLAASSLKITIRPFSPDVLSGIKVPGAAQIADYLWSAELQEFNCESYGEGDIPVAGAYFKRCHIKILSKDIDFAGAISLSKPQMALAIANPFSSKQALEYIEFAGAWVLPEGGGTNFFLKKWCTCQSKVEATQVRCSILRGRPPIGSQIIHCMV